jgi:hypothetical protein
MTAEPAVAVRNFKPPFRALSPDGDRPRKPPTPGLATRLEKENIKMNI